LRNECVRFVLAGTQPLAGRYLLPSDEEDGAAPVVVIGYRAWQSRFGGNPQIVGRPINLGGVTHTIVGVMPEGFYFPYNYQFWIPFRANSLAHEPSAGRSIHLFDRL
jgi:putative ABC transport system permease protein